ncbi:hypothetical protein ACIQ9K_11920 [Streptomyces microflavus]|uniref:Uncharacterized protein n=1 Tax=Streptomyces microflavus DSM 40593 TaxID=1303692 RepID=N0CSM2_STRMI|nr:hypothetical protein [Streptomyces microflavus]AGK79176.1 hypothetical protein SFUL_4275 [Streptomyces microflavus DSM 40593]MCX4654322.1 hypothetical protein [Streptomyces microflavus]WSA62480.1 hypothetical protein OHB31_21060 [Streptomyces microflavus]
MPLLHRRIAPALVVAQLLYLALMELAFTFLSPGNPEPDATGSARNALLGYGAVMVAVAAVMAGGALMLASSRASAAVPRPVRSVLLVLLGLLELGIAAAFLHSAATGSLGPDTVIAGVAVVVSGCVAAGCVPGPAAAPPTQHTPHGRPTARTTG